MLNENQAFNNEQSASLKGPQTVAVENNQQILEKTPEFNSFGLSEKLSGANNLVSAETLVARLNDENQKIIRLAHEEFKKLSFSDEELEKLFTEKYKLLSPESKITLRDASLYAQGDKPLGSLSQDEKIEQMRYRLAAFRNNFYSEFNGHFANGRALLAMASQQGTKLKDYTLQHYQNQVATSQFEYFEHDFLNALDKAKVSGASILDLCANRIDLAIDHGDDFAKRNLLLAYNLRAVPALDLEAAFNAYYQEKIKPLNTEKPADQAKVDYRRPAFEELYYSVMRKVWREKSN